MNSLYGSRVTPRDSLEMNARERRLETPGHSRTYTRHSELQVREKTHAAAEREAKEVEEEEEEHCIIRDCDVGYIASNPAS